MLDWIIFSSQTTENENGIQPNLRRVLKNFPENKCRNKSNLL